MIRVEAFAKINLSLSVLGRRADSFHDLDSLVQTIDLADGITVRLEGVGIRVNSDLRDLRGRDLAEVAAERILHEKASSVGVSIAIKKRIPVGAGLGGGSSDAAAVLVSLDRIVRPRLAYPKLERLAATIGSDVPLFLRGGLLRMTGRGEVLHAVGQRRLERFVLLVPPVHCDTSEVYQRFDDLGSGRWGGAGLGENDLLGAALSVNPALAEYHDAVETIGAQYAGMSGSGASFFAAFSDWTLAGEAEAVLRARFPEATVLACSATGEGQRIIEEG